MRLATWYACGGWHGSGAGHPVRTPHNKSLEVGGGSVFRIMIGPAMLE
jgi:hypothetical protein